MKKILLLLSITALFIGCKKDDKQTVYGCDMQKVYAENAFKVTITHGIWGTIALTEGDCMPTVPPNTSSCRTCPVKRTVKIYNYTLQNQAVQQSPGPFYESISTTLIKEIDTDENGFFQAEVPVGKYSIVVVENGKLYNFFADGEGALTPVNFQGGKQNVNLTLTYKATY